MKFEGKISKADQARGQAEIDRRIAEIETEGGCDVEVVWTLGFCALVRLSPRVDTEAVAGDWWRLSEPTEMILDPLDIVRQFRAQITATEPVH
jgi:hypothetical protein